ncbi:helix-turn-helix transcriptional regulator [Spirillospora sp. NPDC052269]
MTARLLDHFRTGPTAPDEPDPRLTEREAQVASLVARGHTNAEIAAELFISPGTAKTHVAHIHRKLGVRNRVEIAAWAWENGHVG